MPVFKQPLTRSLLPFILSKTVPLLTPWTTFSANLEHRRSFPLLMTDMRAGDTLFIAKNKPISCSPILVEETHPKSINKGERNNARSVNCWRGGVIIFSNNYDKIALLWVWAAPYPTLPSASRNIWIIHKWSWFAHKWFLLPHKFWISRHLEMIYWWHSLGILPVTTGVLLVPGLNLSLQWWWIMPEVSLLQWLLQIWFLFPGNSLCASERRARAAYCCHRLSSITVPPVAS